MKKATGVSLTEARLHVFARVHAYTYICTYICMCIQLYIKSICAHIHSDICIYVADVGMPPQSPGLVLDWD